MVFANWNVPVGVDYCNARGQAVSCNFNNPTPLQPDYNIVGKSWYGAFLTTSWSACIVSIVLISFEYKLWRHGRIKELEEDHPSRKKHHRPTLRTIHVLERLINAFSEQQSVAALSLIVVAGHDGCELSAYIYNLVCFQLIMSLISHLNALTNTRNWFGEQDQSILRGIISGIFKIVPIVLTIIMTGIMLAARIGNTFPSSAGQAASFPAACFENPDDYAAIEYLRDVENKAEWAKNGFIQYMILVLDLIVVAFIFIIALLKKIKRRPDGFRMKISLILRCISTAATTGMIIWLTIQYLEMRSTMEGNPAWYENPSVSDDYSYYNVVTWVLFASSLITIIKALAEAIKGNENPNVIKDYQRVSNWEEKSRRLLNKADMGSTTIAEISYSTHR